MAKKMNGELVPLAHSEYGPATLVLDRDRLAAVLRRRAGESRVWMSHGDTVVSPAGGFVALAHTARCAIAAIGDDVAAVPTASSSIRRSSTPKRGRRSSQNFLRQIAQIPANWRDGVVRRARDRGGAREGRRANVICALSGGVDSAVAATLVSRAIGKQLTCIFVDHGLLRKDEAERCLAAFRDVLHLNVVPSTRASGFSRV